MSYAIVRNVKYKREKIKVIFAYRFIGGNCGWQERTTADEKKGSKKCRNDTNLSEYGMETFAEKPA